MKQLMNSMENKTEQTSTLQHFVPLLSDELILSGRHGTARAYTSAFKRLTRFTGKADITFAELTPALMKQFEQHLYAAGSKRNSISLYMRMLRSICNQAVRRGLANIPHELFHDVFTGTDSCEKRAMSPAVIRCLHQADLESKPSLSFARDMFLLSFYLRGIPYVDLIHLRKKDLNKGVLRYRRSKTNRLVTVCVEACAMTIFRKYASSAGKSPYLLPVITRTGQEGYRQYQSALRLYNKRLHCLSEMLELKENLTSYVARHSWATAAYRQGIPVAIISESLGHASEKMTYHYLASFDNRTLRKANRKVIALMMTETNKPQTPPKHSPYPWINKAIG
ncbi:site-specific integrase [uncultured Bacteroides sp.]|uniref:tyrosine-type recombinase/integrase n=1 Tax=uncultured Bacteroides sp. TaxID=162156 RepID=UPI002AA68162|nr:site-specific integrase [uncultured Bacteroides sp.]